MKTTRFTVALAVAVVVATNAVAGEWSDDFDSYNLDEPLPEQSDWFPWDGNDAHGQFYATTDQWRSEPQSVAIDGEDDAVHTFSNCDEGSWCFTAWQYVPAQSWSGQTYFILLNTYDGSPNWSTQLQSDPVRNVIESQPDGATLPLIKGEWVEIRVAIDLEHDLQTVYYGGQILVRKSWTDGVSGGGNLNVGAVDLWAADSAYTTYYDDMTLTSGDCNDCNGNDVSDYLDILYATSFDCNRNNIPDECEDPDWPDCNTDGIPDGCDIGEWLMFPRAFYPAGDFPWVTVSAEHDVDGTPLPLDFDGDGYTDLATSNNYSDSTSILLNNGDGSYSDGGEFACGLSPWGIVAADIDGQNGPDLVLVDDQSWEISVAVLLNNGDGTFASPYLYPSITNEWECVAAADLDGDEDIDVVITNQAFDSISLLFNNGTEGGIWQGFADEVQWPLPGGLHLGNVVARDLDGDLDVDLAATSNDVWVLENNGDGTFQEPVTYYSGGVSRPIAAADLDGDTDLDLVTGNLGYENSTFAVLFNLGDGTFSEPALYPYGTHIISLAICDINGDTSPDVVVAGFEHGVSAFPNLGDGTFDEAIVDLPLPIRVFSVTAGFLDGDSYADIAIPRRADDGVAVYLNAGGPGSVDCNDNLIPDECEPDCNENGIADECDIDSGYSEDCNANGIPDECDIDSGFSEDCNENDIPDECDIDSGFSEDLNEDGIPDECQGDVRVVPVVGLIDPATTSDTRTVLEDSVSGVVRGSTYYIEIWASDVGEVNTGLTGVYVDLSFCEETTAEELFHGDIFTTFATGTIETGHVDEFGGVSLPHGGGIEPEWVRVGWIEMRAALEVGVCEIALEHSATGVAAFERGLIEPAMVQLSSVEIQIAEATITYDLDGDGFVGVGDLAIFAGSWMQAVPPADPEHDFDCDYFVGPGDLSWFATAWLKYVDDPTIMYPPPCDGAPAGPRGPRAIDVDIRMLALDAMSASDLTEDLPTSIDAIGPGETYYLEIWASDVGDINTGFTSVYVDLSFPDSAGEVADILHGGIFTLFETGEVVPGGIDELGGSALPGGEGIQPQWARVAIVEMTAGPSAVSGTFDLLPSDSGVACYGRGTIAWDAIALNGVEFGDSCPADVNDDEVVDIDDIFAVLAAWGPCDACPEDINTDGVVDIDDLFEVLANWGPCP